MHHRLPLWLALLAFVALGTLRAQTPPAPAGAPAPAAMPPGQITAKQVTGSVSMVLNGTTTPLHDNDRVSQSATIITQADSSVVLVFSNGATTQLGGDTTLSIDEFLQDPFSSQITVGNLTEEPTRSKTKLHLTKGELLGKVAHLKIDEGSSFTVETPVGAAGIRGTTFRIVFRPTGTGQAFAVFSLSTVEGNVNFQQGGANAGAQGQPNAQGNAQGTTQPGTQGQGNAGTGTQGQAGQGTSGGVAVTGGQEVVVTVSVNVDAQTGQVSVTAPPTITSTQPISVQTEAALVQQAQNLATTASTATFTPEQPASSTSGGTTNSSGSTQADNKNDQKQGDNGSGDTSGGDSNGTGSTGSGAGNGNPPKSPPPPPPTSGLQPSPGVLTNPIPTDPGAGQPGNP